MNRDIDLRLGAFNGEVHDLLAALDVEGLDGVLLELDGDARELHEFIEARSAGDPALLGRNRRARRSYHRLGPLTIGGRPLTVPLEGDTLTELRRLATRFAGDEIAICLSVRDRDGTLLIEAPVIGDSEIWANSKRLSPTTLAAMRNALASFLT